MLSGSEGELQLIQQIQLTLRSESESDFIPSINVSSDATGPLVCSEGYDARFPALACFGDRLATVPES